MTLANLKVNNLTGGTITGKEIIIGGGTAGIIRSENFVTGTSGWAIFGDGSAEFNNIVVRGDIESGNWDGASPANLAAVDSGATVGFYLDSSAGAAQFMGDVFLGGNITTIGTGGYFSAGLPGSGLRLFMSQESADLSSLTWSEDAFPPGSFIAKISADVVSDYLAVLGPTTLNLQAGTVEIDAFDTVISLDADFPLTGTALTQVSWTPTLDAITTAPTLGSGSSTSGYYLKIGRLVIAWGIIQFGSSGAAAGSGEYLVSLPVTSSTDGTALAQIMGLVHLLDSGTNNHIGAATLHDSSRFRMYVDNSANRVSNSVPFTWTNNDRIAFVIAYFAST